MTNNEKLFQSMLRIRMIEERIAEEYSKQEMRCPVHLSIGQEAVAVGVCSALSKNDWVFSGHRAHAHFLAKGGDFRKMLAEIFGKETGCAGGRGGSMHLVDKNCGFLGSTPIVGSTIPVAVGAALTLKIKSSHKKVAVFFGDGACETGVFHESLNFASTKSIPVIFVCENNFYSVYSPMDVRQPTSRDLSLLASAHGIKSYKCDGNEVDEVLNVCLDAIKYQDKFMKPVFLEFPTYRWLEHCGPNFDNDIGYRSVSEFERWKERDPLTLFLKKNVINDIDEKKKNIVAEINEAFEFARSSKFPNLESLNNSMYSL